MAFNLFERLKEGAGALVDYLKAGKTNLETQRMQQELEEKKKASIAPQVSRENLFSALSSGFKSIQEKVASGDQQKKQELLKKVLPETNVSKTLQSFAVSALRTLPREGAGAFLEAEPEGYQTFTPTTAFEKFIFGEEPVETLSKQTEATLKTFGVPEDIAKNKLVSLPIGAAFLGLDLFTGGGKDDLAKILAKTGKVEDVITTLRKSGVADDLADEFAEAIAKTTDEKQVGKILGRIIDIQSTTKAVEKGIQAIPPSLQPLAQEARKYRSAEEFVAKRLNGKVVDTDKVFVQQVGMPKVETNIPERFKTVIGRGIDIKLPDNRLALRMVEDGSKINISGIVVEKTGGGIGTKALEAIRDYAIAKGKEVNVYKVTNPKYFDKISWLKKTSDGGYNFDPKSQLTDFYERAVKLGKEVERGFATTVKESAQTAKAVKAGVESFYNPSSNTKLLQEARTLIGKNVDEAIRVAKAPGPATAYSNIISQELIKDFQAVGRYEDAIDLVETTAKKATTQGQAIQALSLYDNLSPEGVLRYMQRLMDRANASRDIGKKLKLSDDIAKKLISQAEKVKLLPDSREKVIETARLVQMMADEIPVSILQRISAIQTMAQLINPKTFIRNIGGNIGFAVLENIKDVFAVAIDTPLSFITGKRTKTLPSLGTQLKSAKIGLLEGIGDALNRVDTSFIRTQFDLPRTAVFKGGVGRSLETLLNIELRATDRAFYKAAHDGSLYQQMKLAKVADATEDMKEVAHAEALYRTFQDDSVLAGVFSKLKRALNAGKEFGVGDFVLKYPRTPANLLARGIDYSPGGFVKAIFESAKPLMGKPFNQRAFVDAFSRATIGSAGLVGLGSMLHKIGIITGKPEKDQDVKAVQRGMGLGQYRLNASALKRFVLSGFNTEQAKLQEGDTLVSYDWFQPQAIAISMGANIDEGEGVSGAVASILDSLGEGINTLAEQPLISGLRRVMRTQDFASTIEEVLKGVPSSFIPTILSQVNQLVDNTQRNTYSPDTWQYALNLAKYKVPGLAQTLPSMVSVFGDDLERYQGGENNIFNVFFNPAFTSKYVSTPEAQMVIDLMEMTGETTQVPRIVQKTIKVNGESKKLTPTQITALQRYVGTITKELFSSFAGDPRFQKQSAQEKVDYLSNVLTDIGRAGKIVILGDRPERPTKRSLDIIRTFNGRIPQ